MTEPSGSRRLAAFLAAQCVKAELVETGSDMPTVARAAEALGVGAEVVVKSIVLEYRPEDYVALAIVGGTARVDRERVAAQLRVPRLTLATPDVVSRTTGYAVGGVPPVGHTGRLNVVIDRAVLDLPVVFGGGGDEHHMLRISPGEIVRLTGALVADIASRAAS